MTLTHAHVVIVDEANFLLMCDVHIVDVHSNDAVVGLFPFDEMRPAGSIS